MHGLRRAVASAIALALVGCGTEPVAARTSVASTLEVRSLSITASMPT
jgi:hypothetical protein